MNCIIVDDNHSIKQLERLVAKCSSLNLVGTFSDTLTALTRLSEYDDIDLAFVDINITGIDGFELFEDLSNPPRLIVVSSTDQYALRAFDFNAVDYLLKPVNYSRFCRAVDKSVRINSRIKAMNYEEKEVFIRKASSLIRLKMKEIIYVEGRDNYVILTTRDKKFNIHFTMKGMENQLPPDIFIRIHRSFIINKRMIRTINEASLDLSVGDTIINLPISKSFRLALLDEITVMDRNSVFSRAVLA